jgi:PQQ-dependent catabolism-associated beta-propeller protein
MAHFIDAETFQIRGNVLVDQRPRIAEFTADGAEVWVSAEIGGTVSVIDPASLEVKKKISFEVPGLQPEAMQPVGVRILKDRSKAFVALGPANRVAIIDARTYEVLDYILVGQRVWQLALSPDEKRLFSSNGVSNDITMIDVEGERARKSIPTGSYPWGIAIKP